MTVQLTVFVLLIGAAAPAQTPRFKYAPAHSLTVVCYPDDWQKTLVSGRGALAYDFGPGPYAVPLTEVGIGLQGQETNVDSQWLADPAIPVVSTTLSNESGTIRLRSWALPGQPGPLPSRITDRVSRLGGLNGCLGWASPRGQVDPAFRNAAWGTNRPIRYRVDVRPGAKATVALGMCEPYKWGPGTRMLELRVEGAPPRTVDPLAEVPKNTPVVELFGGRDEDGDGLMGIEVFPSARAPDPNVFLNAFWLFPPEKKVTAEQILSGRLSTEADVYFDCGRELELAAPGLRLDAITGDIQGGTPVVMLRTGRQIAYDSARAIVTSDGLPFLLTRPAITGAVRDSAVWQFSLPEGTKHVELVAVHGTNGRPSVSFPDLALGMLAAERYWRTQTVFPRAAITVPDPVIQYLLQTSMRTLYQVREFVDGKVQFQPGPTVYRGMWVGDVILAAIPALMAGDSATPRAYLESVMGYQDSLGQVRVIYPNVAMMETPMVVAAACWYATATDNREWLERHWAAVQRGMDWLIRQRRSTGRGKSYSGLMPPGFVDGGLAEPTSDYGTAWWTIIALEQGEAAAEWLGKPGLSGAWREERADLRAAFLRGIRRDMRSDSGDIRYLPVAVGDTSAYLPQRGQWALLLPVAYSRLSFDPDPAMQAMLRGNLAMLDARREEGLVVGSGWIQDAVWAWLGGVYAMAHLHVGDPARAPEVLSAYAEHAAPTGVWVEEQTVRAKGTRTGGDISDAEQSSIFVALVRSMIALERGASLEFLRGVPRSWFNAGAMIRLENVFTRFGPTSFRCTVSGDGTRAEIVCDAVDGRGSEGSPVLHLRMLRELGFRSVDGSPLPDVMPWAWKTPQRLALVRDHPGKQP